MCGDRDGEELGEEWIESIKHLFRCHLDCMRIGLSEEEMRNLDLKDEFIDSFTQAVKSMTVTDKLELEYP